jgi:Fur family ferric uptake transcriptional regulator
MTMESTLKVKDLLTEHGLRPTPHRCRVLEAITHSPRPVSAREVLDTVAPQCGMNRVTVYRILDILVENRLLERISSADRSFRYGLSAHIHQRPHAHFYCMNCGHMQCLEEVSLDQLPLKRSIPGDVSRVELRLDGTCRDCLTREKK